MLAVLPFSYLRLSRDEFDLGSASWKRKLYGAYAFLQVYRHELHAIAASLIFQMQHLSICTGTDHTNHSCQFLFHGHKYEVPNMRIRCRVYSRNKPGLDQEKLDLLSQDEPTIL